MEPCGRCGYVGRATSTKWYIGAWVVWVGAMFGFSIAFRHTDTLSRPWFQDPNLNGLAIIAEVAAIVMAAAWIGALVRLARQRQWQWFAAVLLAQLLWAGIAGIVCYAGYGPDDDAEVSRPQVT